MNKTFFTLISTLAFSLSSLCLAEEPAKEGTLFETQFGKDPTYIRSKSLTLKQNERIFIYENAVEMKQGDMKMTSEMLEGNYDENNKIQAMVASKNVIITKGLGVRATGERARYESKDETMTLTGSPELIQGDSVLTADKVVIYLEED
ncbi:MAG: hypothetical protein KDD62_02540, partial [Bdellovibrionales bacterium]|nr:hypothetical protein [Bdellovibrionales bacterium]